LAGRRRSDRGCPLEHGHDQGEPKSLPATHIVPLAGHFAFLAPCSPDLATAAPEICSDLLGFDRTAFHRDFNAAIVACFHKQLEAE